MRLPSSGGSDDWHDGLDDVFHVMDAQLSLKRGTLDPPNPRRPSIAEALAEPGTPSPAVEPAQAPLPGTEEPLPEPPAPFVERRKPRPAPDPPRDEVDPAAAAVSRSTDHLSPEALDAIATRVAEKLRSSQPMVQAPAPPSAPGARSAAPRPPVTRPSPPGPKPAARAQRPQPLITIRFRRPFFSRRSG